MEIYTYVYIDILKKNSAILDMCNDQTLTDLSDILGPNGNFSDKDMHYPDRCFYILKFTKSTILYNLQAFYNTHYRNNHCGMI